jgi:hypothetical protein
MAMVFKENAVIVAVGSVPRLIAAILASRTLASFLCATPPRDPWVLFCPRCERRGLSQWRLSATNSAADSRLRNRLL